MDFCLLYDKIIPVVQEIKFLRIISNPKLIYNKHIYALRFKCKAILSVLFNTYLGSNHTHILIVFRLLVCFKLDNGRQVMNQSITTYLVSVSHLVHLIQFRSESICCYWYSSHTQMLIGIGLYASHVHTSF